MLTTLRDRALGLAFGATALLTLSPASAQMNIALVPTADPEVFEFHWTANAAYSGIMNSVFSIRWDASAGGDISEDDFVNLCSNTRAPLLTNDLPVEVVGGFRYFTFRCDGSSALGTTAQCGFAAGQTRVLHRFRIAGISGCPNIGLSNDAYLDGLNRDYFVSVGGVPATGTFLSGQIGAPFTVTPGTYGPACSTAADITLGGTPAGGTWSGTGVTGNTFDPSVGTQTLTYTVTQGSCTVAQTTTITVSNPPSAGTNGTLTICAGSTVTAAQLFAQLGGSPQAGGAWTPTPAGAGLYTYTVAATAPCTGNATATVNVTAQPAPNAGTNGTLTICAGTTVTAAQLFARLGGSPQAGGTWTPTPAGAGLYTYTVAATAPCTGNATATVNVTAQPAPNAGTNGTLTICAGSTVTAAQLFAQLGGSPQAGGTWTPTPAGAGLYTYTVAATAPCTGNATATVNVTAQPAPNAGTNGTLTICAGSTVTAAQLFAQLGGSPQAGGTWTPTPAGAGLYTYTVAATAPCTGNATATVNVTAQPAPNAGTNGTLTICAGSTVTASQLFAQLGGSPQAGGTWTPTPAGAGLYTYTVAATAPCTGNATATVNVTAQPAPNAGTNGAISICAGTTVTAAQLFAGLNGTPDAGGVWSPALAGAGVYTYTVAATAPCTGNATAQVTVTEGPGANAGTNGTLTICAGTTVTTAQLFDALNGTPNTGGVWTPTLAGAGVYTYTVTAVAPCTGSATATVTVTAQPAPNAGTNGTLTICTGTTVTAAQLFARLGGSPQAGGTWTPTPAGAGLYTYTVAATAPCTGNATATVNVTAQPAPNAGTNGAISICAGTTVTAAQLFAGLNGTPDAGGVWSPALAGAGVYTYTVAATAPCTGNATAQVTVTEGPGANAGTNGTLTICVGTTVTTAQLFDALNGTPNAGGVWTPTLAGAGVYTYTVTAVAPCTGSATATVTVTAQPAPNAGTNGTLTICDGTTVTAAQLFAQLGGSPQAGGSWSPALEGAGLYTYTVTATAPCTGNATATVNVTAQPAPNAGTNGAISICAGTTVTAAQLFAGLNGTPDAGGVWSPALAGAGVYTYTVAATAPCTGNATAQVTVTEGSGADAGTNGTLSICEGTTVTTAQLFDALNGTPNTGGVWTPALAGAGVYTYTVTAAAPCTGTATATVTVTAQPAASAGNLSGDQTICEGESTVFSSTVAGGLWSSSDPAVASINANNGNVLGIADGTAIMTYTVEGTNGCPAATATLSLTVEVTSNNTTTISACDTYTWTVNGETYTQSGTYTDVDGCATEVLVLTITPSSTNTNEVSACGTSYLWAINGQSYTASGTYQAQNGCVTEVLVLELTVPNTPCDDGNNNTINDTWSQNCTCVGEPVGCEQFVNLVISTDGNGAQTTWEIVPEGGGTPLCQGGPYTGINNSVIGEQCCLNDGCYALRVFDSAGDGMTTGGYVLKEGGSTGRRIIDNTGDGVFGSVSAIAGGQGFCLPLSDDRLIFAHCDREFWLPNQYVVATANAAVSATWIPGGANSVQPSNSGYEFWIYDPDGSYSYRRFRSHNVSDGFSPASATRACHMKINGWFANALNPHIPANVLMNVRIRARVAGQNFPFGPACRFKIDPVLANCPPTELVNTPGTLEFSCGVVKPFGTNTSKIYAWARPGANRYQYEFTVPGEGNFLKVVTSNNNVCVLNWTVNPLVNGVTYNVRVRISKDQGVTWCPWGEVCFVTISNGNVASLAQNAEVPVLTAETAKTEVFAWPNPNTGEQLSLSIKNIASNVEQVGIELYDLTGKQVQVATLIAAEGQVNTSIALNDLRSGVYLMRVTAGDHITTERIVVQR